MTMYLSGANTRPATLVDLLRWRAQNQPDQRVYTFLSHDETDGISCTYGELDQHARTIGAYLQQNVRPRERVLLLHPPSLEYIAAFFGCLYANAIAIPAYPPRLRSTDDRIPSIIADAGINVALAHPTLIPRLEELAAKRGSLNSLRCLTLPAPGNEIADSWTSPDVTGETLAFLQYTSGSTATPKGVMLSHNNLLHNLDRIQRCFGHSTESHGVIWLPPYHDMGLIGGILQPLYAGFPVTLMSPTTFLQAPLRWLSAITETRATTSGGPNFAYDLCVRKITPQQRATLDLSSWEVAFTGAEPIRAETLTRFAEIFAPCGFRAEAFYPCYGLAEATLIVTGGAKAAPPVVQPFQTTALGARQVAAAAADERTMLVGCGQVQPDDQVRIVDPQTGCACQADAIGEIWVAGPSIAQGYWNNPEATSATFGAHLTDSDEGPFLRTGDIGFLCDGELFVTGRLKDLIIIRGRNYYPQDLELTAEQAHSALRPGCGAAFAIEVDGAERLVIVYEVERQQRNVDVAPVASAIRQAIAAEHEIQVYAMALLKPGGIPKTSSGKIQRQACRAAYLADMLPVVGHSVLDQVATSETVEVLSRDLLLASPPDERFRLLTAYLHSQFCQSLGVNQTMLQPDEPLSKLGIDSLAAIEVRHRLEADLQVDVPFTLLLQDVTLTQLADKILNQILASANRTALVTEPRHEPTTEYPLSYGQRIIWILHQLAPTSAAYNISRAVRIHHPLNTDALRHALHQLVIRHEALRTVFAASSGEPRQHILPDAHVDFSVEDAQSWNEAALRDRLEQEAHRPFDLERGPLLRLMIFERAQDEHILLLVVHHIIVDFWSLTVLLRELNTMYAAEVAGRLLTLPPLEQRYSDYVSWQSNMTASAAGEQMWSYWQQRLRPEGAQELPVLDLPTDRPRPLIQTYTGAAYHFQVSAELSQGVQELSAAHGTTLYMTLLAAFQTLLFRMTGQEEIIVGSPTAGRNSPQLRDQIGYYINLLVMRTKLNGAASFASVLAEVRQLVLDAFEHHMYPFGLLAERLQSSRDASRSPLFQTMFIFQQDLTRNTEGLASLAINQAGPEIALSALNIEPMMLEDRTAQFDLTLMIAQTRTRLSCVLQYNTDLFDAPTIARMAGYFQTLLGELVAQPDRPIGRLSLLTVAEQQQIVGAWSGTTVDLPQPACIHELFQAQADRTPEAVAALCKDESLSYRELNARANQLAHHLQQLGVGPEVRVAVCMERSLDLMVAVVAVLKAGGAYVPLDPTYPAERLQFMLSDSQPVVLLTLERFAELLPNPEMPVICLDRDWSLIADKPATTPSTTVTLDNVAYVIYTSGSTGQPKGVLGLQRGVVYRFHWMWSEYPFEPGEISCQKTAISFVDSIWELLGPLLSGVPSVVIPDHMMQDPHTFVQTLERHKVSRLWFVPSFLRMLLDLYPDLQSRLPHLKMWVTSGEALPVELCRRFEQIMPDAMLYNLYGTSEVWDVTWYPPATDSQPWRIPIGYPIANAETYILDRQLNPTPIGVPGELYVGGMGVARGYLNRPDLTAEKFVPNPVGTQLGARLYRTGDLARWLPDGNIEYLGRRDHQTKVRGFRIELSEIEAVLKQHSAVRAVVVIAREDTADRRLAAYVVLHPDEAVTISTLRTFMRARVPGYMVPAAIVLLPELPLTPNGKVDRKALPKPEDLRSSVENTYIAPKSRAEQIIAGIWEEVLGIKNVGTNDNFFDLGGSSLQVVQVHTQLRDAFDRDIAIVDIFRYPTVGALAAAISQDQPAPAGSRSIDERIKRQNAALSRQKQSRTRR